MRKKKTKRKAEYAGEKKKNKNQTKTFNLFLYYHSLKWNFKEYFILPKKEMSQINLKF